MASASFSLGAFANQVVVQNVQSLAGNHVLVPAPELQVLSSSWNINGTASLITGVTLNLTTVSATGATGFKLYQIFIQVSCLNAAGVEFTCSTGTNAIPLPVNRGSALLVVGLTPPIDPETTEVHDLSFIVTGTSCTPDFILTVSPTSANFSISHGPTVGFVTPTLTANSCFAGTITVTTTSNPAGLAINPPTQTLTLSPGQTVSAVPPAVVAGGNTPVGTYIVTVTTTSTFPAITHSVTVTFNVNP